MPATARILIVGCHLMASIMKPKGKSCRFYKKTIMLPVNIFVELGQNAAKNYWSGAGETFKAAQSYLFMSSWL